MSRKWTAVAVAAVVVLGIVIAGAVIVLDQRRDELRQTAAVESNSTTSFSSPYDFAELPADVDLEVIAGASFVSILVPNQQGRPSSYGVSMDRPAAQALADAVRGAREVGVELATEPVGSDASLTFVLPSRETATFAVDLDGGLVTRGGRCWKTQGDLQTLVGAATAKPG